MLKSPHRHYSVCPECMAQVRARIVKIGGDFYLLKKCREHGNFSAVIWRGAELPRYTSPDTNLTPPPCPNNCGLCERHLQSTCCVLVNVTDRCNLNCPICFADAGKNGSEPSISQLAETFKKLVAMGLTFVQLSGGEPTVRDDLPEIIAAARDAGCENIQLNSNGLRLGAEPNFAKQLADAGLSFVFMQFDGLDDDIYQKLRARALLNAKLAAIEVCGGLNLGVTLVPTIVPGVNDGQIGDILKFGFEHSPIVRGVHYQPISYFGRYPITPKNSDRITLPEVMLAIETQTGGLVKRSDLAYSACDHPRCGFHGDFAVFPDRILALTKNAAKPEASDACCCNKNGQISNAALRNRKFVSRRWKRTAESDTNADCSTLDGFAARVRTHGFTVTGMAFQDRWTLDSERLQRCSLHVYDIERDCVVPFCSFYSR